MLRLVTCRAFLVFLIVFEAGSARNVTVCPGTSLSIRDLAKYNRKNCTVIEGPLVLHGVLSSDSDDMSNKTVTAVPITPLSSIVEITGTLEVFHLEESVDNLGQILPNLAVVRGHPHHRYPNVNASVVIAYNEYLKSINLTKLTHIVGDDNSTVPVLLWKNKKLQYIHTVKWDGISTKEIKAFFFGNPEEGEGCPLRHCNGSCWSNNTCQTLFQDTCYAVDSDEQCTCHPECLSSCSGRAEDDCTSCKNFHYQGRCVSRCPDGTFKVAGWRCVDECTYVELDFAKRGKRISHPLFAFKGECVLDCPGNYTEDNHTKTCVPCSNASNCEKRCSGGIIRSLRDAESFQGCVHVEGNLEINILTESNEDGKLSLYLGSVQHVHGYVIVINSPRLETLEFLDNLTSIAGHDLWPLGDDFYGLVIINNRNLRSVYWKKQQKLWLGGRTDVQVLITANYMACEDSIMKLELQFPYSVDIYENGILAVCNPGNLNLTSKKNGSGTIFLEWDPVPLEVQTDENRTLFIGYQIFWQTDSALKSAADPFPKEYDENNPESCGNTRWRSVTVGNVTSYKLSRDMLLPWNTTVFQVRAEFSRRGIGFKSDMLRVNGTLAVPSCPIIEYFKDRIDFNVTVLWRPPKYYRHYVTHYRIAVSLLDEPLLMRSTPSPLGNRTSNNISCSVDTAVTQSRHSCINYTFHVTDDYSCDGGWCAKTITELRNYFKYQVEIQATSPAGCGPTSQKIYVTEPDYELDKVSDLNVTVLPGPRPSPSTENVQVSWRRPAYPNGGHVQYYELRIEFQVSQQEESDFQHSHSQWVLPRMKDLGCNYSSGNLQSYFCQIRSNKTRVLLNLTLMRVPGKQLSYDVVVRVASALGKPSDKIPKIETQFTVSEAPRNQSSNSIVVVRAIIVLVVVVCLVLVIVVLVYVLRRQKRKSKTQSRAWPDAFQLYACLDRGIEYLPDEWEIQRDEVVLNRELGRGAFGLVYQGTWQSPDGQQPLDVAVKTLNDEAGCEDRLSFLYEASVMKHFSNDHIVRLLGIVSQGTPVMVVMELMEKGDLKGYLRSFRPENEAISYEEFPISEEEVLQIAVQIASGMAYLTTKKFVHRDLAARNCMVTGDVSIKIGDFGLTRDVYHSDYYRKRGQGVLPVRWMPPESLRDGVFTHSSDVWSFGIVLWEVATLAMQPYPGMSNSEVYEFVVGGGVMDVGEMKQVPNALLMITESCWLYKPSDRPTFESICGCLSPLHGRD